MSKRKIGLIVEDETDFEALKIIISKLDARFKFIFEKRIADGKGKFKNKLTAWTDLFSSKGCHAVVAVVDADTLNRNEIKELTNEYEELLRKSASKKKLIVVTFFELETWLLYDTGAIKKAFGIKKEIKKISNPEGLVNSKEKLRDIVEKFTKHKRYFYSTNDNKKIASHLNVKLLNSCTSFIKLKSFIDSLT